jgi:hypothetical protein
MLPIKLFHIMDSDFKDVKMVIVVRSAPQGQRRTWGLERTAGGEELSPTWVAPGPWGLLRVLPAWLMKKAWISRELEHLSAVWPVSCGGPGFGTNWPGACAQ